MASLREAKPLTEMKSLSQSGRASYREEGPFAGRPASHGEARPFTGICASHREDGAETLTKSILNIFWKAGLVEKKRSSPSIHKQPQLWASSRTTSESSQEAEHLWSNSHLTSVSSRVAGQPWMTNQPATSSSHMEGQYWLRCPKATSCHWIQLTTYQIM